jgi:CRISPR-associated protein Csm2
MQQQTRPPYPSKGRAGGYNRAGGYDNRREPPRLPEPVVLNYFKDAEKKILDPNLLDSYAKESAQKFRKLKSSQMRRFYDEIKAIERKILSGDERIAKANFERDRALIVMLNAKAVYAQMRDVAPPDFTAFIFNHVASINDLHDFKAFVKVFEAVVAFHKFFAPDK